MSKINGPSQRIFTTGSPLEREAFLKEIHLKVEAFNLKARRLPPLEREQIFMKLIEDVRGGREEMEVLWGVTSSGGWLLELESCLRRTRWLKSLASPKRLIFTVGAISPSSTGVDSPLIIALVITFLVFFLVFLGIRLLLREIKEESKERKDENHNSDHTDPGGGS